ncbi:unnamed protein product [Orchesella dallaii]|uniref:Uncharacterized protein n=1 Tax=Orchesella dallaii TaxID=48710 RepID=A0ABP1R6Y0_9HEXA
MGECDIFLSYTSITQPNQISLIHALLILSHRTYVNSKQNNLVLGYNWQIYLKFSVNVKQKAAYVELLDLTVAFCCFLSPSFMFRTKTNQNHTHTVLSNG